MVDSAFLAQQLTVPSVAEHLPMWTTWGVRDSGHWVHSLGCTAITALGQKLGFAAVSEAPAPHEGAYAHLGDDVRSDSVWFDRGNQKVTLIAEFERYAGKQKDLRPKVENLLLAQQRWGNPGATLLLAYWSIGLVTVPDHGALRQIAVDGYQTNAAIRVAGNAKVKINFYQFVARQRQDGLLILDQIIQRGAL